MLTKNDINASLARLSEKRPVFHSEADFQFALGQQLNRDLDQVDIRMERPFDLEDSSKRNRIYLDIQVMTEDGQAVGLELKYMTKALQDKDVSELKRKYNESYKVRTHFSLNLIRYDFLKDIMRLETLKRKKDLHQGFALLLTNRKELWEKGHADSTMSRNFPIHEGAQFVARERYEWVDPIGEENNVKPSSVGEHRYQTPLCFDKGFALSWQHFSRFGFRYCLVEI